MYRLLNPLSFVAFKMGRLRGGPSRTGTQGGYLDRYVTDEQRSSRPHFNATLRGAAGWLFFRPAAAGLVRPYDQIAALRSRLEKQPTDMAATRRSSRDLGDGTVVCAGVGGSHVKKIRIRVDRVVISIAKIQSIVIHHRALIVIP